MGRIVVALLASCILSADYVFLQGTARLQTVTTPYNGIEDKNHTMHSPTLERSRQENRYFINSSAILNTIQNSSTPKTVEEIRATNSNTIPSTTITERPPLKTAGLETQSTVIPVLLTDITTSSPPSTTTTTSSPPSTTTTSSPPSTTTTTSSPPSTTTTTSSPPSTTTTSSPPSTTTSRPPSSTTTRSSPPTTTTRSPSTAKPKKPADPHVLEVRSGADNNKLQRCPRSEDIHPCECVEVVTASNSEESQRNGRGEYEVETVAFCKNIRNTEVLREALRGMQGRHMTYLVFDSVHLPPFPNDLLKNVGVGWMEVLNSTMQFQQQFFQCYEQGCN